MHPYLLSFYQRMPAPLQSLAASFRGGRLLHQRYGPETDALVAAALEREHWSSAQWEVYQQQQLGPILERARATVPAYRSYFDTNPTCDWRQLSAWPFLSKESLRRRPQDYLSAEASMRGMSIEHTSGTTGTPVKLYRSRSAVRSWYALFEARCRAWYGISRQTPWAILGGQLIAPVQRRRPPFWVWNAPLRQLYLSSYHLNDECLPHYVDAIERHRVEYLLGYTSSLCALAHWVLRSRRPLALRLVLTNAEPLLAHERALLREAFGCPVRETYGMTENVAGASECDHGRLHLWPDAGVLEVVRDDPSHSTGRFVCTGLLNADMPLIRYEVGDTGHPPVVAALPCPCGRTLPVLPSIEGRTDDLIVTAEGRKVGRLDPVFKADLPVREVQIIQERLDRIRVIVVPDAAFNGAHAVSLEARLRQRLGDMQVVIEQVASIPRTANGKFRAVISLVSKQ